MRHQGLTIGFATIAHEVGVRRTEHDVNGVGAGLQNRRHRIDHDFDTLVRRQQSEGQDDRLVAESERSLGRVGLDERKFRDAVRDDLDLLVGDLIDRAHQLPAQPADLLIAAAPLHARAARE